MEDCDHVPFKDKRKPESDTVCTLCGDILEKGQKPTEFITYSAYQPGVKVMLRDEVDDDSVRLYQMAGIRLGEGTLIQESKHGGDIWDLQFDLEDGGNVILSMSTSMFFVVDDSQTQGALVEAILISNM
jgi:hypothetical protein